MSKNKGIVLFPILIWFLFWFLMLTYVIPFFNNNDVSNSLVYLVIFLIAERLILLIAITEICKTHLLKPNVWFFITLIFGINAFLFINLQIWFQPSNDK